MKGFQTRGSIIDKKRAQRESSKRNANLLGNFTERSKYLQMKFDFDRGMLKGNYRLEEFNRLKLIYEKNNVII